MGPSTTPHPSFKKMETNVSTLASDSTPYMVWITDTSKKDNHGWHVPMSLLHDQGYGHRSYPTNFIWLPIESRNPLPKIIQKPTTFPTKGTKHTHASHHQKNTA